MSTVTEVLNHINEFAPFSIAMDWDNVGLLVGDKTAEVTGCVLALDVTNEVIEFAVEEKANLIVTHHPVIFGGLKKLTSDSLVYKLIQNNVSVISAHTNLDLIEGGVNYALADALKLTRQCPLLGTGGLGRVGELEEAMSPYDFATHIKQFLPTESVSYTNYNKLIKTVAVVGGEGSDYAFACPQADAYVSGEIKHHIFVEAHNRQAQIFAVGHYQSEVCVLEPLSKHIIKGFDSFKTQNYLISATRYM